MPKKPAPKFLHISTVRPLEAAIARQAGEWVPKGATYNAGRNAAKRAHRAVHGVRK